MRSGEQLLPEEDAWGLEGQDANRARSQRPATRGERYLAVLCGLIGGVLLGAADLTIAAIVTGIVGLLWFIRYSDEGTTRWK